MDTFTRLLGDLRPDACNAIIHVLDVIFQACPFSFLGEIIVNTGLLWKIINSLLTGNEVNKIFLFVVLD
jgi:hypothetical protein